MMLKKLIAIVTISLSACAVLAESYQAEVGLNYQYVTFGQHGSRDAYGAHGTYYFSKVNTSGLPLAEAAFLNRSSNLRVDLLDDLDSLALSGEWYVSNIPLYLGAQVIHEDTPFGSDTHWMASIGLTPVDGLLLYTRVNDDSYNANLQAKYLMPISANNSLNLEAAYEKRESTNDYIAVFADYYFSRRFSVGLGYEDLGTDAFSLRSRLFFTQALSAEIRGRRSDFGSRVEAGIRFRF